MNQERARMRSLLVIITLIFSIELSAEVMKVYIEKEVDDDHIILITAKGDRLYLEKWSMKFSPLLFEGKTFLADISPLWVKIYVEGKGELKWSIEKHLGTVDLEQPNKESQPAGYAGVGSGHWIQSVSTGGKIIKLEDGSLWEISPIDTIYTGIWLPISNITVIIDGGPYPYKLINTDDGESVNAKYLGS